MHSQSSQELRADKRRPPMAIGPLTWAAGTLAAATAAAAMAIIVTRRHHAHPSRRKAKGTKQVAMLASSGRQASLGPSSIVPRYYALTGKKQETNTVSILSWNILSDGLVSPRKYPWVSPGALDWRLRSRLLQAELRCTAADVVALQEVQASRWQEIQSWLPGWCSLLQEQKGGQPTDGNKKDLMLLGLFWKPCFQLVWCEHRSRAILAQLSWVDSEGQTRDLWVINCHLEGHPYRPNDRVNQIRSALTQLQARQAAVGVEPASAHVVVVGDMNSGRTESVWRFLARGRLEGGTTEAHLPNVEVTRTTINHPYQLEDCYQAVGNPVPWSRKAPQNSCTIDYMWASNNLSVLRVYDPLRGTRAPPVSVMTPASDSNSHGTHANGSLASPSKHRQSNTQEEPEALVSATGRSLAQSCRMVNSGLPNLVCPSDHLPLGVVLQVKPTRVRRTQSVEHSNGSTVDISVSAGPSIPSQ